MRNPKLSDELFDVSVDEAPACAAVGLQALDQLAIATSPGTSDAAARSDIYQLLQGMQSFFSEEDNCNERFLFAKHKSTVASLYIGAGLGKPTANSALDAMAKRFQEPSISVANRTAIELCDGERLSSRIFGLSVDNTGDLAAVQAAALGWSSGKCTMDIDYDLRPDGSLASVKIFDIAGTDLASNSTVEAFHSRFRKRSFLRKRKILSLEPRALCDYLKVEDGDGCPSLAAKCGLTGPQFMRFNSKTGLCANLQEGDYICCSAGDPYKPPKPDVPKPQPDGTCATHIIENGDTCDSLARRFGVTISDLEKWNKGKTWAWTKCAEMILGYSMCISSGNAALPPPQEGAQCGPMVPGTKPPTSSSTSLADLNPCPLKVCCSNWGFCGIFPVHCTAHKVEGGSPGAKPKDIQSTCVSNCGMEIVPESSRPSSFDRIGYYESWNLGRTCLWLKAEDANTDGSYTHMHWGFLDIDPQTWKPIVTDPHSQWEGFKNLANMKRVASIGGWAYSTDAATYNILRRAIIDNRDLFATNLAAFVKEEGIDGIDIDWEYPGAPDIEVGGQVIGKETDGGDYLRFLASLRQKLGPDKIVAIAAPASYWYLKAFPIDRIARFVDYIVYMTYDLHGQWDAGNPNAYDSCDSGRCIRSHVNLTETRNALGMVTKAGVSAHKIFVGESSYGRSFRMAKPGCWGPMCDFTGSRTESNADPGRCTKTGGYLANAEINEIIKRGGADVEVFRDQDSGADVLLFGDNYVSFLTSWNKYIRRSMWTQFTFAGTIDWAVDLQEFTELDANAPFDRDEDIDGKMCNAGDSFDDDTGDICEFTCLFGYCPEPVCNCLSRGTPAPLPPKQGTTDIVGINEFDHDMNRLCKFSCQFGHCPPEICTTPTKAPPTQEELDADDSIQHYRDRRTGNARACWVYEDPEYTDLSVCKRVCEPELLEDQEKGLTTNYGCVSWTPGTAEIPWQKAPGGLRRVSGNCECNNWLVNFFADTIIEALPIIAQMINHFYEEGEDPVGAFEWWLWPCGSTSLVPDDIKEVFDILTAVTEGISYKEPKLKKGTGKKGDKTNPRPIDRKPPKSGGGSGNGVKKPLRKCRIPKGQSTYIVGQSKNTLRMQSCVGQTTMRAESVITSLTYAPNAQPTMIHGTCSRKYAQACYHYSSVIRNNPSWATIQCPQEAAKPQYRFNAFATSKWDTQRAGGGWLDPNHQPWWLKDPKKHSCQRDEFPPAYLLNEKSVAYINSGKDAVGGQLMRFLPHLHNIGGGKMWKGACFSSLTRKMTVAGFKQSFDIAGKSTFSNGQVKAGLNLRQDGSGGDVSVWPRFTISSWEHSANPAPFDGLYENECWPKGIVPKHAGFVLLDYDPWNKNNELGHGYDYKKKM
ncbi:hypothetical protein ACHAQA_004165 [Verticillium albo-atrum]